MPLEASYKELIKSNLADLKNIGAKGGGSITAALFLQVCFYPYINIIIITMIFKLF